MTSNKFCPKCSYFDKDNDYIEFSNKYGQSPCYGIPYASTGFPDESPARCFTDKPLLTIEEKRTRKIQNILAIIKDCETDLQIATYIVDHYNSL